jgi:hypothetical protein
MDMTSKKIDAKGPVKTNTGILFFILWVDGLN